MELNFVLVIPWLMAMLGLWVFLLTLILFFELLVCLNFKVWEIKSIMIPRK